MSEAKHITGYEGIYTIDERGNVYSCKFKDYLSWIPEGGEYKVRLYKNGTRSSFYIKDLVVETFVSPGKYCAGFIDGNHSNIVLSNMIVKELDPRTITRLNQSRLIAILKNDIKNLKEMVEKRDMEILRMIKT